jgi:predicted MarR family transcription regulator
MGIYALTPADAQLELIPGKNKKFSFKLLDSLIVNSIEIYDRKTKDKEEITFLQTDNIVSFSYEFKKLKKQLIDIYVNSRLVATYRVLEKREEK